MKYFLLLLITFNVYAEYRLEITSGSKAKMSNNCVDLEDCKSKISKWADKNSSYRSEWMEQDTGFGVSKIINDDETGESKTVYLKPLNYSFEFNNISAEIQADEARKARKDELKSKGQNLNIKELIELLEIKGII